MNEKFSSNAKIWNLSRTRFMSYARSFHQEPNPKLSILIEEVTITFSAYIHTTPYLRLIPEPNMIGL